MNFKIVLIAGFVVASAAATHFMPAKTPGNQPVSADPTMTDWQKDPNGSLAKWLKKDPQRSINVAISAIPQCVKVGTIEGWERPDLQNTFAEITVNGLLIAFGEPNRGAEFLARLNKMSLDDQRIYSEAFKSFASPENAACIGQKVAQTIGLMVAKQGS